jgi:3-oxoacyl-[acyl-carrier protein] reductase
MKKRYLIVGGSRGIGLSLSKQLAGQGNQVIYASRNKNTELDNQGCQFIPWDAVNEEFPNLENIDMLDGLVYCPGSITLKPFKSLKAEQFITDYQINVIGAVKSIQANLNRLKNGHNPSIVLFSTVAVQVGMPFHSSISAAKAAVEGLCRSLAAELAPAIRVNCVAPSLTQTDLAANLLNSPEKQEAAKNRHPLKNVGSPEDLANMASFLLSSDSKWISGQVFHVDGGLSSLKL